MAECKLADENCGGAEEYLDGKCYWHFKHTDRDPEHLATMEEASSPKRTTARTAKKKD